jgi:hypothetical protein
MKRKQIQREPLAKKIEYCLPCGIERRAVPASTKVDGDPMCVGCAHAASKLTARDAMEPTPKRRVRDAVD